ncbi:outer membrane beta-barrel protein [Prosthecochloris sp. ZM]|uniref:outer membrane protein n=1 Tax=Prosthecochloris sp. ZM TaxID=2283143 RepID=UPI00142DDB1B|nr:outer membrane beta-barrel protein [Prosthecochloris sp. ZM]
MKKALSLVMVFLVAVAFSATGYSADKYISGNIGISWLNDYESSESRDGSFMPNTGLFEFGSGLTLAAAFGCDYGDYRAEAEIGYQSGDVDTFAFGTGEMDPFAMDMTGDISILSIMGNGYYDIALGSDVELFLMAGAGFAQVNFDDVALEEEMQGPNLALNVTEVAFAYQIGAGLALPVSDGIMLEAKYRYFATTDFTVSDDFDLPLNGIEDTEWVGNIESHSAMLGMRVML